MPTKPIISRRQKILAQSVRCKSILFQFSNKLNFPFLVETRAKIRVSFFNLQRTMRKLRLAVLSTASGRPADLSLHILHLNFPAFAYPHSFYKFWGLYPLNKFDYNTYNIIDRLSCRQTKSCYTVWGRGTFCYTGLQTKKQV